MTRMKRSEFKSLVKECVRECLKEIMQEQINPVGLREMFQPQQQSMSALGMVNPMDDQQMRMRQEILQQKGMLQGMMQRQAQHNPLNPMQQQIVGLDTLAGVSDDPMAQARRYSNAVGYTNPSDHIRFAEAPRSKNYDHRLDSSPNGPIQQQTERRVLRLDPSLDTPIGGGDLRLPDPNVLKGIFDDTMRTTYMQQMQHEQSGQPADRFAATVSQHNPEDLFVGSQNWASLAFK